jgi:hypothetical protein
MNLNQLLRKINWASENTSVFIDGQYLLECAYFEDDSGEVLSIETTLNGKMTIFNVESVDGSENDSTLVLSGGDETFTMEFVPNKTH